MNEEEIKEKEVYKKYKEKIIDRIITIDKPDVEIYHSILFGSVNIDNKNIDKINKIGIFDNINLRTIKMFKNIIDLNNLDINNNDEENIYKLKTIYSILNFEYNNRYKNEDLIEKN